MRALSIAALALLLPSTAALADTFTFSASDPVQNMSTTGTITATNQGSGQFLVTSISGANIGSLISTTSPAAAYLGNDNLLFPSNSRQLDVNGIAFTYNLNGTLLNINLFSPNAGGNGYEALIFDQSSNFLSDDTGVTFTARAVTPEPSSLALLGTGILTAGAFLRRRLGA